MRYSELILIFR